MKNNLIKILSAFTMLFSLLGCSLLPGTGSSLSPANASGIVASGTIQVDSVRLGSELSGKIQEIGVKQGDEVQAGQVIFRLDASVLQIQRKQVAASLQAAQAAQNAAQANLDLIQAGASAEQLKAAQAQLDQTSAGLKAAQSSFYAIQGSTRPEDLTAAQTRLDLARSAYYGLTAALPAKQIDEVTATYNQAQSALSRLQDLQDRLSKDQRNPPDAVEAATNAVTDIQTLVDYAKQASQSATDDSQPLYLQIAAVQKTSQAAILTLSQAQARLNTLRAGSNMSQAALDAAQTSVDVSQSLVDQARNAYTSLNTCSQAERLSAAWTEMQNAQHDLDGMGHGASGSANLETLLDQMSALSAQRDSAQANFANLKNGPRPEAVTAAQAQLDAAKAKVIEAQAVLDGIDLQIQKLAVSAPMGGIILTRLLDPGEIAPAGAAVVELGDLDQVTLKVYVPEDQYGKIKLGQAVSVRVDSFPGRVFSGTVTHIANQAEYTPRNVQTQETRSTTVYAIELRLPNPDHTLKPGMPADATF